MNTYRVMWVGARKGELVPASTPYEAWDVFHKRHPNFRDQDDEGPSYYVTIETLDGEPLLEAGETKFGKPFVAKHPDAE